MSVTKFVILSLKPKLYLLDEQRRGNVSEKWTIVKGLAKTFNSKWQALEAIDVLQGTTFLRTKSDCIVIPIKGEESKAMVDFEVKICHSQTFCREEIISASSDVEVLDKAFAELVKPDRVIMGIEISRCKKNKVKERDLALGFERSL